MDLRFKGQILKFGTVDKYNRKFASDCKITFPDTIPVTNNFNMDEIIGVADISKVEDGLDCEVSLFDMNVLPQNVKDHITVIDSARLVSMSILPEHNVADENLKVRRVETNAEN